MNKNLKDILENLEDESKSLMVSTRIFQDEQILVPYRALQCSVFGSVTFFEIKFSDINLSGSLFLNCTFRDCKFEDVDFRKTEFKYSTFQDCKFKNCTFIKTEFNDNSVFLDCDFVETDFLSTYFCDFKFIATKFENCNWDSVVGLFSEGWKSNQAITINDSVDLKNFLEIEDKNNNFSNET